MWHRQVNPKRLHTVLYLVCLAPIYIGATCDTSSVKHVRWLDLYTEKGDLFSP